MRIFENANFSFIPNRRVGYVVSAVLLLASISSFIFNGLELGIDFKGGMEFVIESSEPLDAVDVRSVLTGLLTSEPEVKTYQTSSETGLLIRTLDEGDISEVQSLIVGGIEAAFPGSNPTVQKTDIVGPRFAEDLKRGAIFSLLGSLLVIFVYILIRFEWRFGVGAVVALLHDVTITLGIFSLLRGMLPFSLQIDQTIIAAFLTIVGYSLNDTVVVFDRIREYTGLFKAESYPSVVNRSINNTLSRTVVTSSTTLLVVVVLFIFGGEVLKGFAFALIIGILIGTYSSVFVAAPVVIELKQRGGSRK
ncbi:MAG: protein translocase subunit SecF [Bacteroidetes bacterium]|nr:protein translocase subunit SecF [Bacteroidota bacterium]